MLLFSTSTLASEAFGALNSPLTNSRIALGHGPEPLELPEPLDLLVLELSGVGCSFDSIRYLLLKKLCLNALSPTQTPGGIKTKLQKLYILCKFLIRLYREQFRLRLITVS